MNLNEIENITIDDKTKIDAHVEQLQYENMKIQEAPKNDLQELIDENKDSVIKTIEEQPKVGEWKHISEELPNKNEKVLWRGAKSGMFIGYIVSSNMANGYVWVNVPNSRHGRHGIVWRRLPKPYKGELKDE